MPKRVSHPIGEAAKQRERFMPQQTWKERAISAERAEDALNRKIHELSNQIDAINEQRGRLNAALIAQDQEGKRRQEEIAQLRVGAASLEPIREAIDRQTEQMRLGILGALRHHHEAIDRSLLRVSEAIDRLGLSLFEQRQTPTRGRKGAKKR